VAKSEIKHSIIQITRFTFFIGHQWLKLIKSCLFAIDFARNQINI